MKKKNVLMMAMSLVLVAVIAIGGTLAYLSDTTDEVKNTFVASDGIGMTLDEAPVDPETGREIPGERRTENTYNNVQPDVAYDKDPTLHFSELPHGGADVYVVIKGVAENAANGVTVELKNMDAFNVLFDKVDGYKDLYVSKAPIEALNDIVVFDGIEFSYSNETATAEGFTIAQIKVQAYAAQADMADAATAAGVLGATPAD